MRTHWRISVIALCSVVAGCFALQATLHKETSPPTLCVGTLPDQITAALRKRHASFLEYLSAEAVVDVSFVLPSDYGKLVRLFRDRDAGTRFTSLFLVKDGDSSDDLADFKEKRFSFGSPLSSSGLLMPRRFMETEMQLIPKEFFSELHYFDAHDETAYLVRHGAVDLEVANTEIITAMIRDGRLKGNDLRVLWQTPPFTDYVWAVSNKLNVNVKTRLRDAFLGLGADDAAHSKFLESLHFEVFLVAGDDFLLVEQISVNLGLLDAKIK